MRSFAGVEKDSYAPFSAQVGPKSRLLISLSLARLAYLEHLEPLELLDVLDNLGCLARSNPYSLLSNS